MENPLAKYIEGIENGSGAPRLDDAELEWFEQECPYFSLPFATEAAEEKDVERRGRLMEHVALAASDSEMLFRLLSADGKQFDDFYMDEKKSPTPSTDAAIDTFLSAYGKMDAREEALLERLIFNPVPDYSAVLEKQLREEDAGPGVEKDAVPENKENVDAAVKQQAAEEKNQATTSGSSMLSESLAKIYIKKGRFDKAFEIISQLNLNFPEKSIYFADQLRFLRKLMHNQQLKEKNKN